MCDAATARPRFYRFDDLLALVPCGRSKLWALTRSPGFPAPRQLGASGPYLWVRAEVDTYLDGLPPVPPATRHSSEPRRAAQAVGRARRARRPDSGSGSTRPLPPLVPVGTAHDVDEVVLVPAERGRRRSRL